MKSESVLVVSAGKATDLEVTLGLVNDDYCRYKWATIYKNLGSCALRDSGKFELRNETADCGTE